MYKLVAKTFKIKTGIEYNLLQKSVGVQVNWMRYIKNRRDWVSKDNWRSNKWCVFHSEVQIMQIKPLKTVKDN